MDEDFEKNGPSDLDNYQRQRAMQKIKIALPTRLIEWLEADLQGDETRSSRIRDLIETAFQRGCDEPGVNQKYSDETVNRIAINIAELNTTVLKLAGRIEFLFKQAPISDKLPNMGSLSRDKKLRNATNHEDLILTFGFLCVGILLGCWMFSQIL
ncbi:hypothetical protein LC607_34695 [Nostoc sp. CHAB 5824]|nr:hypothetical protein [Nostoc sp. CHAB 5824]